MRKLHYFVLLGCISLCVLLFSAFWWNESNKSNTSPSRQPYQIQVILKAYHQPPTFWRVVSQGIDAAETEFGVNCEINAPDSESDLERQIELVREAIAKKPDAIILAACDYEKMTPVCKEATDAGILLVTLDSDVNFDGRRAFVGTDNYEMGKKLAGLLQEEAGSENAFGVISHVEGTSTAAQRLDGLLDNTPNASSRMAALSYCNGFEVYAKQLTIRMLQEHPEIKCMVGLNESSALGIAAALNELGLADQIPLVVCDSSEKQIQFLENGTIRACVVQNPFSMGYLSVANTVKLLNRQSVDAITYTDSVVVHRDYLMNAEIQQLIIPFRLDNQSFDSGSSPADSPESN